MSANVNRKNTKNGDVKVMMASKHVGKQSNASKGAQNQRVPPEWPIFSTTMNGRSRPAPKKKQPMPSALKNAAQEAQRQQKINSMIEKLKGSPFTRKDISADAGYVDLSQENDEVTLSDDSLEIEDAPHDTSSEKGLIKIKKEHIELDEKPSTSAAWQALQARAKYPTPAPSSPPQTANNRDSDQALHSQRSLDSTTDDESSDGSNRTDESSSDSSELSGSSDDDESDYEQTNNAFQSSESSTSDEGTTEPANIGSPVPYSPEFRPKAFAFEGANIRYGQMPLKATKYGSNRTELKPRGILKTSSTTSTPTTRKRQHAHFSEDIPHSDTSSAASWLNTPSKRTCMDEHNITRPTFSPLKCPNTAFETAQLVSRSPLKQTSPVNTTNDFDQNRGRLEKDFRDTTPGGSESFQYDLNQHWPTSDYSEFENFDFTTLIPDFDVSDLKDVEKDLGQEDLPKMSNEKHKRQKRRQTLQYDEGINNGKASAAATTQSALLSPQWLQTALGQSDPHDSLMSGALQSRTRSEKYQATQENRRTSRDGERQMRLDEKNGDRETQTAANKSNRMNHNPNQAAPTTAMPVLPEGWSLEQYNEHVGKYNASPNDTAAKSDATFGEDKFVTTKNTRKKRHWQDESTKANDQDDDLEHSQRVNVPKSSCKHSIARGPAQHDIATSDVANLLNLFQGLYALQAGNIEAVESAPTVFDNVGEPYLRELTMRSGCNFEGICESLVAAANKKKGLERAKAELERLLRMRTVLDSELQNMVDEDMMKGTRPRKQTCDCFNKAR
ncbi:MAG: hypothetical protein Q9227_005790 [Pyrenula ochraceoflavens]